MNKLRLYILLSVSIALIFSLIMIGFYLALLLLPILLVIFFFNTILTFFKSSKEQDSNIIDAEYEIVEDEPKKIEKTDF